MAKVRVVNTSLDSNLNGTNFNNTASETIFSFGSFSVTSNFDGRQFIDYSTSLSSFVRPVTLDTMGISLIQSESILLATTNAVLNLDRSDLNTFVKFGSSYEFLRISIQNIILAYPASIFVNSQTNRGGNVTFINFAYNKVNNISTLRIPVGFIVNTFGLITNNGNTSTPNDIELKNLNLSYNKYVIWSATNSTGNSYSVIGFTGNSAGFNFLQINTIGNPFPSITGTSGSIDFHVKPNNDIFEEFRMSLSDYEKYIVSERSGFDGFKFTLKNPTLLDDGSIMYSDSSMLWITSDKYNIDINTSRYSNFLETVLTIGNKYDSIKTDLISRFLTPASIRTYDLTEDGKMEKLLRIYGREFDQLKQFIDSLVNINHVTYDKINNVPDQLIKNLSKAFGWEYFSLVNENELVSSFLSIDDTERNLNTDLLPAEIDIELWRRILINTNYFWKSKGTREAIKSMFLLIGIPEPFINITEYIYTVDGKIDPRTVKLIQADFPSNSLPYDTEGYPVTPLETNDFYFQVSGDTDSGQAYLDVFRMAGFNLMRTVDNKKSWIQTGATTRVHSTTPQYFQNDSKLVINTKEVDVALDTSRGIEYDVYDYIKNKDFPANSSGYTLPFSYVNISLGYTGTATTFTLPAQYNKTEGDLEVRYNGILLNAPKEYSGSTGGTYSETTRADYIISGNTIILTGNTSNYAINSGNRRDVIQATFIYSGNTHPVSGITVEYIVTRIKPNIIGTVIPIPSYPRGDVQVTVDGIALTKGTNQFIADYIVDPNNSIGGTNNIIIQNPEIISYLAINPDIQITYVQVNGSNNIAARSEVVRVDSFNSGKIYFNNSANKFVYKLNYKVNNASEVKILIDGIALEPYKDYNINVNDPYEIYLPKGIRYGTIISAYYLVAGNAYFTPIIADSFGVGDISKLSFLEFIELIQRKLINAKNRKTITDFRGGWYPSLLKVYVDYLKRANLPSSDPLHSNGYTFENLYSFLSKYNSFFQRFVDQLLSATIILRKGGLLIRNSVFTNQKFTYKRGVNVDSAAAGINSDIDSRIFDLNVNYLGDDGSTFMISQPILPPPPPVPVLYVDTIVGSSGINNIISGGKDINGKDILTKYGMQYRETSTVNWYTQTTTGKPLNDNYAFTLVGLTDNTSYEYRAYIESGIYSYAGNILQITTQAIPVIPSIATTPATNILENSFNTGGINIIDYNNIEYYAVQYRVSGTTTWLLYPTPPSSGSLLVNNFTTTIVSLLANTKYEYRAYMVVGGTPYYGLIYGMTTQAIPLAKPTVITGNANLISTTGMVISANTVTNKGIPATILEYGILYSQNGTYGTTANLVYGNIPPVGKISTCGNTGSLPYLYDKTITGLANNTMTYYRAFAKNSTDYGYGQVYCATTLPPVIPPAPTSTAFICGFEQLAPSGSGLADFSCVCAKLGITNPSTLSGGDGFRICFTNNSYSKTLSALPSPISTHAWVTDNGCASINDSISSVAAGDINESCCVGSSYIDVLWTNIDNITLWATACSCLDNGGAFDNYASVNIFQIIPNGLDQHVLTAPTTLYVNNACSSGDIGGGIC